MAKVAPDGPVYQAGTLSGNPLSVAAGIAALTALRAPGKFDDIVKTTDGLCESLRRTAQDQQVPVCVQQVGTMFTLFFTDADSVPTLNAVGKCDFDAFKTYFHAMRDNGVSLPPSQYEANFVSAAHGDAAIRTTLSAAKTAFALIRG
jgi:glutamate-1-semialdehyde 2,1-aminomutase